MVHHTGSDNPDQRALLYNGLSDLPGPLCHFGLAQTGVIHLIGWGRANHAGGGDPDVYQHVLNEDYTGVLKPRYHQGSPGAVDGNTHFYGVEIWYDGTHHMNDKQYATLLKLGAAICDFHSWSYKSVIGHGEWSDWKWDPGYKASTMMDMSDMRLDIAAVIKKGPNPVADVKSEVYRQTWETDAMTPPEGKSTETNSTWMPQSLLRHAAEQAEAANVKLDKLIEALKALGLSL
jgi:hypothetical protein